MATLPSLIAKLVLDSAGFVNEAKRVNAQVAQINRSFSSLNSVVKTAGAALGGLGAGIGLAGLARMTKQALDAAGGMAELAAQTGVTTRDLQVLKFAAAQSGVEFGAMSSALGQFARRVGEAAAGNKAMAADFQRMGLALTDSQGNLRTSMELFSALAERVQAAGSTQEQMRIATEALGRSGGQLLPILQGGAEAVEEFGDRLEKAGLIMSGQMIQKADQASDAIAALQLAFTTGFQIGVVRAFNLELNTTAERMGQVEEVGELLGTALGDIVTYVVRTITFFSELNEAVATLTGGFTTLGGAIAFPAKQLKFYAELLGAVEAPDTSLEALAPPEIVARIQKLNEELAALGKTGGTITPPIDKAAASLAKMVKEADQENRQLRTLKSAWLGYGASVEDVETTISVTNKVRSAGIEITAAEKAGLLDVLTANERLRHEIELLNDTLLAGEKVFKAWEVAAFEAMNTEEMGRRMGQRGGGTLSQLGEAEAKELPELFKNALENVQNEFANTFDDISQATIGSFEEMADAAHNIFTNLTSNLSTLAIFEPKKLREQFAAAGLTELQGRAVTAGALATPLLGLGVGMFGNQGARQGLQIGGGLGAAGGALLGSFVPGIGTAAGAIGGGLGGSLLGSIFGGIFGGGGPSGREVRNLRGGLGGVGGTGQAALATQRFDQGLIGILNARQEAIVDQALRTASGVSVKYGKEGPSANDLANLARGRIGTAAQALGFRAAGVAPEGAAPEQQMTNLQTAIGLFRQIEGFRIGPVATQFRDLNDTFAEMSAEAARLGVDVTGLAEAHKREAEALTRRIQLEEVAVAQTVGVLDPMTAALRTLDLQMQEATARAREFGISTAKVAETQYRLAQTIIRQYAAQYLEVVAGVGAASDLSVAMAQLNLRMQELHARATELGISTAYVAQVAGRAAEALWRQNRAQEIAISEQVGNLTPLNAALVKLELEFQNLHAEATRLGISTANLARQHALAAEALRRENRAQEIAISAQVGNISPLNAALLELELSFQNAHAAATKLGISTAKLAHQHALAAEALRRENRAQEIAISAQVGNISPLETALLELELRFQNAHAAAKALGISTANLAREHKRLAAELVREFRAAQDRLALSIRDPFKDLLDPLREFFSDLAVGNLNPLGQMKAAQDEFRRIAAAAAAGSTTAIQQLRAAGEAYIAQAERFGASPAGAAARTEVASAIERVMGSVEEAQRQASAGIENEIRQASQREVDTLKELVAEVRIVAEEIRRNRRV